MSEYSLEDFIVYTFYGHKREHSAQIAAFRDRLATVITEMLQEFKPEVIDFALDEVNPGYRRLKLYSDGTIESEVIRINGAEFRPDYDSEGY